MTPEQKQKLDHLLLEMLIQYAGYKYYGPQKPESAGWINTVERNNWGGGYGDPYDRYGRGNKWGRQKSFTDYRGAL